MKVSEDEVFHTMDDYETDLQLDDHNEVDVWTGEDDVSPTGGGASTTLLNGRFGSGR